jgi:chromosome segregation ATPase
MDVKAELEKTRDALQQQRDEIRIQIHLAKMDVKEEWEKTETQFHALEAKIKEITADASDAKKDIAASATQLFEDIQAAYHRIRRHL